MSLGLIKPGASVALRHPKTGVILTPLYVRKNGTAVWPVLGASSDDPDDPSFTGDGGSDEDDDTEDDDAEDDDDESSPRKKKPVKKAKPADDDEDDDEDDEESQRFKAGRQARRYRLQLREEQAKTRDMAARIKAMEDKDKPEDEVVSRDLSETREQVANLTETNRIMSAQLAFFKTNTVSWADANDAFALAEREGLFDDVIDEDGNVDARELRRGLRDLAKRKPHLVKKTEDDPKARGRKTAESDDEDEDDDEPSTRRSAGAMNGSRKGKKAAGPSRADLAKKFPVLNRL